MPLQEHRSGRGRHAPAPGPPGSNGRGRPSAENFAARAAQSGARPRAAGSGRREPPAANEVQSRKYVYLVKTKRKQAVGPGPLAATTGLQHFSRMTDGTTRLDTWLWAARFYKTRALAAAAVDGGRVELNDQKPKRGKSLKPGDRLRIRLGPYEHTVTVLGLSQRRGPAATAAGLY